MIAERETEREIVTPEVLEREIRRLPVRDYDRLEIIDSGFLPHGPEATLADSFATIGTTEAEDYLGTRWNAFREEERRSICQAVGGRVGMTTYRVREELARDHFDQLRGFPQITPGHWLTEIGRIAGALLLCSTTCCRDLFPLANGETRENLIGAALPGQVVNTVVWVTELHMTEDDTPRCGGRATAFVYLGDYLILRLNSGFKLVSFEFLMSAVKLTQIVERRAQSRQGRQKRRLEGFLPAPGA